MEVRAALDAERAPKTLRSPFFPSGKPPNSPTTLVELALLGILWISCMFWRGRESPGYHSRAVWEYSDIDNTFGASRSLLIALLHVTFNRRRFLPKSGSLGRLRTRLDSGHIVADQVGFVLWLGVVCVGFVL